MATTLEELERRISRIEHASLVCSNWWRNHPHDGDAADTWRCNRFVRLRGPGDHCAAIAQAFAEMGITGEPIGAAEGQELMRACGMQPDANEFSQGIIAMAESEVCMTQHDDAIGLAGWPPPFTSPQRGEARRGEGVRPPRCAPIRLGDLATPHDSKTAAPVYRAR